MPYYMRTLFTLVNFFYLAGGDIRLISQFEEIEMTSSSSTMSDADTEYKKGGCCAFSGKAKWSGVNIAAMVIGFVLWWPIGLFLLFWILILLLVLLRLFFMNLGKLLRIMRIKYFIKLIKK